MASMAEMGSLAAVTLTVNVWDSFTVSTHMYWPGSALLKHGRLVANSCCEGIGVHHRHMLVLININLKWCEQGVELCDSVSTGSQSVQSLNVVSAVQLQ
jgi:hypothetical protein